MILLQRLQHGRDLLAKVDLFAGTSIGGIIALALAREVPLCDIRLLLEQRGPRIFTRSLLYRFGLLGPRYVNNYLLYELRRLFGDMTLGQLAHPVLVPTFDLDNESLLQRQWKPKFFSNHAGDLEDLDQMVYEVAMRTSAAPTYFPTYEGYLDGGLIANNPAMSAVTKILREYPGRRPQDIRVLSFATYDTDRYIEGSPDFGLLGVRTIVDILLQGSESVVDYQCRQLLQDRYCRVQTQHSAKVDLKLDDVGKIPLMINLAENTDLSAVESWLTKYWDN